MINWCKNPHLQSFVDNRNLSSMNSHLYECYGGNNYTITLAGTRENMKLHLLEDLIQRFLTAQLNANDTSWYLPHSLVNHFHEIWYKHLELELKDRYEQALRSEITQRWWKKENYRYSGCFTRNFIGA